MTRAELLTACLKALNSCHILPVERRLGIAWLAGNKGEMERLLTRTEAVIAEREANPNSLTNWASSQKVSRAHARLNSDLSQPSLLNTRKEYTTA